jgi:1-acyl-sn-glycerol-3-phosphate acyltransferase
MTGSPLEDARAFRRLVALRRGTMLVARSLALVSGLWVARGLNRPDDTERRVRRWARRTMRSLCVRIRVEGEVPAGPVVLVANHLSYLDIPLLWTLVPGRFVARADVADWPGVGRAARLLGTLFLDRARKRALLDVLPRMTDALRDGDAVVFFPEATSTRGARVLPFKSALFEAAVRSGAPVVAASLEYETADRNRPADTAVCWWGDMTFLSHVGRLLTLPRIEARVRFSRPLLPPSEGFAADRPMESSAGSRSSSPHHSRKRKELCRLAYEAVQKKFVPTTPPESYGRADRPLPIRSGAASRAAPPAR